MGAKNLCRDVSRRFVVMIIETGFADTDAFRDDAPTRQGDPRSYFGLLMGVVRMRPDGAKNVFIGFGDPAIDSKAFVCVEIVIIRLSPAARARSITASTLASKIREIEVAMAVNQHG